MAAGDGRIDEDDEDAENKKSYNKVTEAIQKYEKTITLSVGAAYHRNYHPGVVRGVDAVKCEEPGSLYADGLPGPEPLPV